MNDFNTLFPNFLNQCAEMNHVLTPIAFVLLVVGIVSSTVTGQRSPGAYLRTVGRTLAFAAVLAYLPTWGDQIAATVDTTVRETLHADPAAVYDQYQKALVISKDTTGSSSGSKSWWNVLNGQAVFEAVISGAMYLLGLLASVIVFYAYLVQKFILYVGFALAPIFIGFLAVRTLHSIGVGFLLGYAGVLCWPIGWGAASLLTSGLIGFMTDQSFLASGGLGGGAGYGLQNLLGLAALAIWLISSTIAAPIIIQKAIATGTQVGPGAGGDRLYRWCRGRDGWRRSCRCFWCGRRHWRYDCGRCRRRNRSHTGSGRIFHQRKFLFALRQSRRVDGRKPLGSPPSKSAQKE